MSAWITSRARYRDQSLALMFAEKRGWAVTAFDNLHRRGSGLALARLRSGGVNSCTAMSEAPKISTACRPQIC